jgi:hypothetical protein
MSRMPHYDPFRTPFQRGDGLQRPEGPYGEAGTWHDNSDHFSITGCMEVLTQITDYQLGGTDPSTGIWTAVVTPILDSHGSAASSGAGPASISFTTSGSDTLVEVVAGLVAAANTAAGLETPEDLATWSRFISYVTLSVSPVNTAHLRATATSSGATFSILITPPVAQASTVTVAAIVTPGSDVLSVGTYCAIDADRTGGATNAQGQPYLELITGSTAAANIRGPVMLGTDTDALEPGDRYSTYAAGVSASLAEYGHPRVYANKAIPATSIGTPVYVQKAASGGIVAGSVTDAAGAAVGATANLWTGTQTAVDSTLYQTQIQVTDDSGVLISETIAFTAGAGTTVTLISNGLRANLLTKTSLTGLVAGTGTTTLILTGPADGRAVTVTSVGPGVTSWVETTAEVSTHILHPRGDTFLAASPAAGPVPVAIPHP